MTLCSGPLRCGSACRRRYACCATCSALAPTPLYAREITLQETASSFRGLTLAACCVTCAYPPVSVWYVCASNLFAFTGASFIRVAGQERGRGAAGAQLLCAAAAATALWRPSARRPADRAGHRVFVSDAIINTQKNRRRQVEGGCVTAAGVGGEQRAFSVVVFDAVYLFNDAPTSIDSNTLTPQHASVQSLNPNHATGWERGGGGRHMHAACKQAAGWAVAAAAACDM